MRTYGIDASSANKKEKTGVEWHAYHVIQQLKQIALTEDERVVLYSPTPLEGDLAALPKGWSSSVLKWNFRQGWMQGRVSWEMFRRPPTVLYVPAQGLPRLTPKNTVTTVHDLGFRRIADMYDGKTRSTLIKTTARAVKKAKTLFAVSEFTKRELTELYRVPAERIVITPNAADALTCRISTPETIDATLRKHRLSNHFFLYVGRLEAKKNVKTLIRAFELFRASRGMGDPFELVLVGNPGFGASEIKKFIDGSSERAAIHTPGYLPDEEVSDLMHACRGYLFPSWYEGFGIPNLEAMRCGTPLITSDIPPHREVAGEAAIFVKPDESEAWARAMRRLVEEHGLRDELIANGAENMKRYSWAATAETILQTLRSLV